MSTSPRRSYRPNLDGFRLEDRVVLAAASVTEVGSITAAAVDPTTPVVKSGFLQQTPILLHAAFQNFLNNQNKAAQSAVRRLANGQNPVSLRDSLQANISLQGGILEAKVGQISKRIPEGVDRLFNANPVQIPLPGSNPTGPLIPPGSTQPLIGLKAQIVTMINDLRTAITPDNLVNPNASQMIVMTYQGCNAAMVQFVNTAIKNGVFTVGPNKGT